MKKTKMTIATIALVLVLTFAATFVALPNVSAHDPPWTVPTYCYGTVANPTIGVGQLEVIYFWVYPNPVTANGAFGDRYTLTIDITSPDGTKETKGPMETDPIGFVYIYYTPDQIGIYTCVAHNQESVITGLPTPGDIPPSEWSASASHLGDIYLPSDSESVTFLVQEEPIQGWKETPLPTEYWERPINAMNREWTQIAGNWLGAGLQRNGPTDQFTWGPAPESAHVMWSRQFWTGGIADARLGVYGYDTEHYDLSLGFAPPIIINGILYYDVVSHPAEGWYAVDLYTGETLFFHNTTWPLRGTGWGFGRSADYNYTTDAAHQVMQGMLAGEMLTFGQVLRMDNPDQHGAFPYLWSTWVPDADGNLAPYTWRMFDAYTGNYICDIENVPRGVYDAMNRIVRYTSIHPEIILGHEGSILYYNIEGSGANKRLTVWNTTEALWFKPTFGSSYPRSPTWNATVLSNSYWAWRPTLNETYDGAYGYSINVSIPDVSGSILAVREGEILIGGTIGSNNEESIVLGNMWALSLKRDELGKLLYNITFTPPPSSAYISRTQVSIDKVSPEDGVFTFWSTTLLKRWVYSLETGEQLWESEPEASWNQIAAGVGSFVYQGKLIGYGFGGELVAYNITTGDILWTYTADQIGYESPYGNFPLMVGSIADGKIYTYSTEHSPTQPLWRGSMLRCIDASNGDELWKISMWGSGAYGGIDGPVVADGYVLSMNFYDAKIYCIGKGPSATTVSVQNNVVPKGDSVLITGTVTDEAPGTKQSEQAKRFPNGVPAISDEYMSEWMEYLYQQQSCPEYVEGVEVTLDAIDPNGNFISIGRVKSDGYGMFKKMWTPENEGEYTIIATFEGSKSYWASYAETAIGVGPAPSPAGPIEPEPTEPEPTEPEPTEPEPTEPEPTEPEPTEPTEAPFITTETAIIVAVAVAVAIGVAAYWALRKRK